MGKKLKYTMLASSLFLITATSGKMIVFAGSITMRSTGSISYIINTDTVNVKDPLNPGSIDSITPKDSTEHQNPTSGPLSLDYVSNIKFGEQKTMGEDATYYAQLDKFIDSNRATIERPNFVQVTDKRGSNAGWHLTVTQDTQFKNGAESLNGASLSLDYATLTTPNDGIAPTASQKFTLTPGVASDVLNATNNQGTGTWIERFGNDNTQGKTSISLSIPGKTKKVQGEYNSDLTWALTDSPA